jgi:O-antigen ligase
VPSIAVSPARTEVARCDEGSAVGTGTAASVPDVDPSYDGVRHRQVAELGLFLLLVASPVVVTPFTASPFDDGKIVCMAGGALCLWMARGAVDRRLGLFGLGWVAATVLAAVLGVEPWRGLTAQPSSAGLSTILVVSCVAAVVAGAGLDARLRERARTFLGWGGLIVAVVAIPLRVWPDTLGRLLTDVPVLGSTVGNQVFAGAVVAAAVGAVIGGAGRPSIRRLAALSLLGFAAASFEQRSTILLPLVVLLLFVWRARPGGRTALVSLLAIGIGFGIYQVSAPFLPGEEDVGAIGAVSITGGDAGRTTAWRAILRSVEERPLTGWGPGSTKTAFLQGATAEDIEVATRAYADAHDLPIEVASASGVVGLAAFGAFSLVLLVRMFRGDRERGWAFAVAVGLGLFALVEPVDAVTTPMLFLMAGIAAGPVRDPVTLPTLGRAVVAAILTTGLAVTLLMAVAASFEQWGIKYGEQTALQRALALQPWWTVAARNLTLQSAVRAGSNEPGTAELARQTIAETVERFPWDPDVRLWAAHAEHLMGDDGAALRWVTSQVELYPVDAGLLEDVRNSKGAYTVPGQETGV